MVSSIFFQENHPKPMDLWRFHHVFLGVLERSPVDVVFTHRRTGLLGYVPTRLELPYTHTYIRTYVRTYIHIYIHVYINTILIHYVYHIPYKMAWVSASRFFDRPEITSVFFCSGPWYWQVSPQIFQCSHLSPPCHQATDRNEDRKTVDCAHCTVRRSIEFV